MISDYLTKEQLKISNHNKYLAWKAFGYNYNNHRGLSLHHKDETLLHTNVERYILWLPEDLEVVSRAKHNAIHLKGKPKSKEHRMKLSIAAKNRDPSTRRHPDMRGEKNPNYGKHALKGRHWHLENGVRVWTLT